jgi:hypothetical protein
VDQTGNKLGAALRVFPIVAFFVCNGGCRFTPVAFSFVPLQLPLAPMRVLAIGIEHALDVPVRRTEAEM